MRGRMCLQTYDLSLSFSAKHLQHQERKNRPDNSATLQQPKRRLNLPSLIGLVEHDLLLSASHLHLEITRKQACRHLTKEAHFPDGRPTHQRPAPARVNTARLLPDDKRGRRRPGPPVRISSRACSTTAGNPTRVPSSMRSTTASTSMSSTPGQAHCLCRRLLPSQKIRVHQVPTHGRTCHH